MEVEEGHAPSEQSGAQGKQKRKDKKWKEKQIDKTQGELERVAKRDRNQRHTGTCWRATGGVERKESTCVRAEVENAVPEGTRKAWTRNRRRNKSIKHRVNFSGS